MLREERNRCEKSLEEEQRRQALLNGENPDEVVLSEKRTKEFEKKKAEFEEGRKQRHLEIVSKLLEEQKLKRRSEKLASKPHWKSRWQVEGPTPPSKMRASEFMRRKKRKSKEGTSMLSPPRNDGVNPLISGDEVADGIGGEYESSTGESDDGEVGGVRGSKAGDRSKTLAKPEIDGLWSQKLSGKRPIML